MLNKVFVGDVGTKIRLDAGQDISSASLIQLKYKKPSGETGTWTGTLEGTDYAYYITQAASEPDLDENGRWQIQLYVELPTWQGHGEISYFHVYNRVTD
jgi:hypothetical protein